MVYQTATARSSERQEIPEEVIFGTSHAMSEVRRMIDRAADTSVPILLLGESGTGKDLLASLIHERSSRRHNGFVSLNCPAIPGSLLETELFGYERGAFTGANAMKPGRVEQANGGTLFLNEISEMDYPLQAKILQLLQDGMFMRVGGQETKQANVRVVCATNRDLRKRIEDGAFREDLYYRIAVLTVRVPSLRERISDLPTIVTFLFESFRQQHNANLRPLSTSMMERLMRYHWPGNIRQLQNVIRRYAILGSEESILGELSATPVDSGINLEIELDGNTSLKKITRDAVRKLESTLILKTLKANDWNGRKTAKQLKISYRALLYKVRDAGITLRGQKEQHLK